MSRAAHEIKVFDTARPVRRAQKGTKPVIAGNTVNRAPVGVIEPGQIYRRHSFLYFDTLRELCQAEIFEMFDNQVAVSLGGTGRFPIESVQEVRSVDQDKEIGF